MTKSIFDHSNLSRIKYNVFDGDGPVEKRCPELFQLPAFKQALKRGDIESLVKFIVLMYDKKSPAIKMFQDISARKNECANAAGYDLEVDEKILKGLFEFKDDEFANMVVDYLKDQNERVWSMICSNEQTFFEYQKALLQEVTLDNTNGEKDRLSAIAIKSKLMEDSDTINERLDRYYTQLFGEESEKILSGSQFTPEGQARKK